MKRKLKRWTLFVPCLFFSAALTAACTDNELTKSTSNTNNVDQANSSSGTKELSNLEGQTQDPNDNSSGDEASSQTMNKAEGYMSQNHEMTNDHFMNSANKENEGTHEGGTNSGKGNPKVPEMQKMSQNPMSDERSEGKNGESGRSGGNSTELENTGMSGKDASNPKTVESHTESGGTQGNKGAPKQEMPKASGTETGTVAETRPQSQGQVSSGQNPGSSEVAPAAPAPAMKK